jgi:hypothetical protein
MAQICGHGDDPHFVLLLWLFLTAPKLIYVMFCQAAAAKQAL